MVPQPHFWKCENDTHTLKMGTWESSGTPKISEFNCKGQNTSHWGVIYIMGKLSKCICRKWSCMHHLDITTQVMAKRKVGSQTSNLISNH